MNYGERLKSAREASGLTQEELGRKIGVTGVTIMRYEKNQRKPNLDMLSKILSALNISISEFMGINPLVDTPENRAATDAAANMVLRAGIVIRDEQFKSDEDRAAFFYGQLNTDGMLMAGKHFFKHLNPDDIGAVADYVEQLAQTPQYQRPQETNEDK